MTELRRRMDEAMIVRGFAARTRETYLDVVKGLARYYRRSPDLITDAEIQAYVLYLIRDRQRSWSTCNIVVCGLRFFYHETLQRDRTTFTIPSPRQPGKLPALLSRDEVQRLIAHASHLTHRTMLLTTYAAGLRLSEVLHLRVGDIDATRRTIRVEQGKGGRDRYTILSPPLLDALRAYWTVARPTTWLFPSPHRSQPLDPSGLQRAYTLAKRRAGITKPGGIHAVRVSYNSCRNRHCPKCQTLTKERWLAARQADLLPIPYFHVVFTLPHDLNALAQGNPRVIYTRLFRAAADTLLAFGRDPRYLGGTIGITAILHTWGQTLAQHLHLHCLVTGGALAGDGTRWVRGRPSFLFPVRAMATVFRAKYLAGLRQAHTAGQLTFASGTATLADRRTFTVFLRALRAVDWVVYAKRPFAGPAQVLEYLGRYTHRVALSNDRLVDHVEGRVRFRWKDYAGHDRVKVMTLEADEFLRRFLLHVVLRGFMRIRHFGLLANRTRRDTLRQCRGLLGQPPPAEAAPESSAVLLLRLTGVDLARCPVCREGRMQITMLVVQVRPPPETS